jgi:hypothetical protein
MSIIRNVGNLHDDTTGALTGYINPVTNKEEALDATAIQALVSDAWNAPGSLSNVIANMTSLFSDSSRLYLDDQPIFILAVA